MPDIPPYRFICMPSKCLNYLPNPILIHYLLLIGTHGTLFLFIAQNYVYGVDFW